MSFVERVIAHVQRVQALADSSAPDKRVIVDYPRHQATLLGLFEAVLSTGDNPHRSGLEEELNGWMMGRCERFVETLHWELVDGLGARKTLEQRAWLVDVGLKLRTRLAPVPTTSLSHVRRLLLDECVAMVWARTEPESPAGSVPGYANALGLVQGGDDGRWVVAPPGQVLRRLRGKDAVRWLLTLETLNSTGHDDPWRIDAQGLAAMFAEPHLRRHATDDEWPVSQVHCLHLEELGIIELAEDRDGLRGWDVTAMGADLISSTVVRDGGPFDVLARAIRDDELDALASMQRDTSSERVDATLRHARMVAHEVRNALTPVRHALRRLAEELGEAASSVGIRPQLTAIDEGVGRLYRFVTESVRLAGPTRGSREVFSLLDAIEDARREIGPHMLGSLTVETVPASFTPRVSGNQSQLALGLLNLLRNAHQVGGEGVNVTIRVDARDASRVRLLIDDDGPGIPEAVREEIFENGVSYRDGGTGYGLASLRTIVEDMGGGVACMAGPDGGARFEVTLPAAEDEA